MKKKIAESAVFQKTLLDFLKQGAVEGENLESTIVDVFSEMYDDEPGPMMKRFAYYLMLNMELKYQIGSVLLDHLHEASNRKESIYDMCDRVQHDLRRSLCLPNTAIHNPRCLAS